MTSACTGRVTTARRDILTCHIMLTCHIPGVRRVRTLQSAPLRSAVVSYAALIEFHRVKGHADRSQSREANGGAVLDVRAAGLWLVAVRGFTRDDERLVR